MTQANVAKTSIEVCDLCTSFYLSMQCQEGNSFMLFQPEQAYYMRNQNHHSDPFSNTYNQGWQNHFIWVGGIIKCVQALMELSIISSSTTTIVESEAKRCIGPIDYEHYLILGSNFIESSSLNQELRSVDGSNC